MNVRETMEATLSANGFDGLYNDLAGCACILDDLMPCEHDQANCEPGYKIECPGEGDCECDPEDIHAWHVVKEK